MKTVSKFSVKYNKKADRMELLWRIPYAVVLLLVLFVFKWVAKVMMLFQILYVLATKKRHKALQYWIELYIRYKVNVLSYLMMLTDERPPIVPEM